MKEGGVVGGGRWGRRWVGSLGYSGQRLRFDCGLRLWGIRYVLTDDDGLALVS